MHFEFTRSVLLGYLSPMHVQQVIKIFSELVITGFI